MRRAAICPSPVGSVVSCSKGSFFMSLASSSQSAASMAWRTRSVWCAAGGCLWGSMVLAFGHSHSQHNKAARSKSNSRNNSHGQSLLLRCGSFSTGGGGGGSLAGGGGDAGGTISGRGGLQKVMTGSPLSTNTESSAGGFSKGRSAAMACALLGSRAAIPSRAWEISSSRSSSRVRDVRCWASSREVRAVG